MPDLDEEAPQTQTQPAGAGIGGGGGLIATSAGFPNDEGAGGGGPYFPTSIKSRPPRKPPPPDDGFTINPAGGNPWGKNLPLKAGGEGCFLEVEARRLA